MSQGTLFSNQSKRSTIQINKAPQPKSGGNQGRGTQSVLPIVQRSERVETPGSYQSEAGGSQSPTYRPNAGSDLRTSQSGEYRNQRASVMGRIGRYFEVKTTPRGTALAVFSVASSQPYVDESGGLAKRTIWHRIVVWGDRALALGDQLQKGARVYVEGKFKTKEWVDRENNPRTSTELVAREVHFLDLERAA